MAIAILAAAIQPAGAQFGGMPGTLPGGAGAGGIGGPPAGPPPKCQALLSIRDDLQKHGKAIEAANSKKADVKVACRLFRNYIATEAKMLRMLETDGAACGAGAQIIQQVRDSHAKAQQIGQQVCDAAARGLAPFRPTLQDALGTSPAPPDPDQKPYLYDGLWPPSRRP
ncbi:MAG TPA: hypothetical protein VFB68_10535 [Xanthobacteraceae bacterium]|nr:hypothetical protein [Xanthobacteraceae bacterium]